MKKIHAALTAENKASLAGLAIAFIAGCISAVLFWHLIL